MGYSTRHLRISSLNVKLIKYFLSLSYSETDESETYHDEMKRIAQIFRIMRILRIFKLARHITGLQTLGFTLKNRYFFSNFAPFLNS